MITGSPDRRLCLIGAGGFGRQILALLEAGQSVGTVFPDIVFARDGAGAGETIGPFPVVEAASVGRGDRFVVTVSSARQRRRLVEQAVEKGAAPGSLVAASARISSLADIAEGAVICDFAVVEPFARVGRHFQANVRAFVAHECLIGDFVTLGPHAVCNGNVHVEDDAYIGAGAIIRQGSAARPLTIGAGATVGMGAVVTKDVPPGVTVVGNPARPFSR